MTADDLKAFAQDVADTFNRGEIRHPVHLSDGNELSLLKVFETIAPDDFVCGGWRFHSQALLKGVPPAELKAAIMRGESIALCFPRHRVICSAIVGGILPIAVGIAMGIKRAGGRERVHCWSGDMTARTGIFHECAEYAAGHELPIRFIIENNHKSVCTPTAEVWRSSLSVSATDLIEGYEYQSKWPHAGAGRRVNF